MTVLGVCWDPQGDKLFFLLATRKEKPDLPIVIVIIRFPVKDIKSGIVSTSSYHEIEVLAEETD